MWDKIKAFCKAVKDVAARVVTVAFGLMTGAVGLILGGAGLAGLAVTSTVFRIFLAPLDFIGERFENPAVGAVENGARFIVGLSVSVLIVWFGFISIFGMTSIGASAVAFDKDPEVVSTVFSDAYDGIFEWTDYRVSASLYKNNDPSEKEKRVQEAHEQLDEIERQLDVIQNLDTEAKEALADAAALVRQAKDLTGRSHLRVVSGDNEEKEDFELSDEDRKMIDELVEKVRKDPDMIREDRDLAVQLLYIARLYNKKPQDSA